MQHGKNDALKQIYRSGIKASYFGGMQAPKFVEKSKLQISKIEEDDLDDVDETTFRLIRGFNRPDEDFAVYKHSGRCYTEKAGFFSCFGARKLFQIKLKNSKLAIIYSQKIHRYIDFNVVSTKLQDNTDSLTISFDGSSDSLYIEPAVQKNSKQDTGTSQWVELLNKIIKETDGKNKNYTYLSRNCPQFYKSEHVLNQQFERSANSGDILLFRSQHSAARLQRLFTDSEFDHVGIVLRNKKNQLYIYQSTSSEGVGLTPWRHMVKFQWYEQTDKICWRPLHIKLTEKDLDLIEAFVVKTLGKGFELTLDKLFQFKSKLNRSEQEEENKTYFCSELAARLYKELGLLNEDKSSTTYFPVDFSQKGYMTIIREGVSIGNERIISFDGIK